MQDPRQQQQVQDTIIMGKVNAAHREAFREKFPNQTEHLLRLISERLQAGLDKRSGVIVQDPNTWLLSAEEILHLSQAMRNVYLIYKDVRSPYEY
jgi:hypothetical protein